MCHVLLFRTWRVASPGVKLVHRPCHRETQRGWPSHILEGGAMKQNVSCFVGELKQRKFKTGK